jgi:hypothetical protein
LQASEAGCAAEEVSPIFRHSASGNRKSSV